MVGCDRRDLVCLHLDAYSAAREQSPASPAVTAAGIGDALELGDDAVDRVRLLDELAALEEDGLVVTGERQIDGHDVPRTAYFLTEEGRDHAATLREDLGRETVVVTNGITEAVTLSDIGRYFDDEPAPLVSALARLTDDGEVPLERTVGERFVDREDALATVLQTIENSITRECRTVVVGGAAGMGKTALVQKAIDRIASDREDLVAAKGAAPPGAADPYTPFRQAFDAIPDGDDLIARLVKDRSTMAADEPEELRVQRTALFDDVADGLRAAATNHPIVLFLDNLQWAEETTLELFAHLATTIDEWLYPVAIAGTYRTPEVATGDHPLPDVLERIDRAGTYSHVSLDPLGQADTGALLSSVLDHHRLPEEFVGVVHERTGGNPLFVRETAAHLLETAQIDPDTDAYPATPGEVVLPPEVTTQIDQRLSRLDESSRELLRLGAVLGERIPARVLAEASDLQPAPRREYVDVLLASRIWEPVDAETSDGLPAATALGVSVDDDGDLQFVSGGVRDAVVDRLPEALAGEYHAMVAAAFTTVHGEDLDEHAARVAYHYEEAGDFETAVEFYRQAGAYASRSYAHEEAIDSFEHALALALEHDLLDGEERAALQGDIGDVSESIGEYDDALEAAGTGLDIAPEGSREQCRLFGLVAGVQADRGEYEKAREMARRQLELAVDLDARELEADAAGHLGYADQQQSEYDRAREHYERSLHIRRDLDDRRGTATSLDRLGGLARERDEYDRAREYFEESLAISNEIGARRGEAESLKNLGWLAYYRGEFDQASQYLRPSLAIAQEFGDQSLEAFCLNLLGSISYVHQEFGQAREYLDRALSMYRELGDRQGESYCLRDLANIAKDEGKYDTAHDYSEQSLAIARDVGNPTEEAKNLGNLGVLALNQSEYDRARGYFEQTLTIANDVHNPRIKINTLNNIGYVAQMRGEYDAARECYGKAVDLASDIGSRRREAYGLQSLGDIDRLRGDFGTAREQLEQSLTIIRDIDVPSKEALGLSLLGEIARSQEEYDQAIDYQEAALELAEAHRDGYRLEQIRLAAGRTSLESGDTRIARERATTARESFEEMDATHLVGRSRLLLGRIAAESGSLDTAREHWRAARETFETIGAPQDELATLEQLVETCREQGENELAAEWCQRAQAVLTDAPDATADLHREWLERLAAELDGA